MGTKKAQVAIAHKLLVACWHILKYAVPYKDLGEPFLTKDKQDKIVKHYIRRLEKMGYGVQLSSV
jgi:transposase